MVLPLALLIGAAQLALLTVTGVGAARLLLPDRLRAHELTLAPLYGLALLSLAGYYGTQAGLTLRQVLPLALGLGAALLAASFFLRLPRRRAPVRLPAAELLPLLLLMLGVWLLSLAPNLGYGLLTPIGHNWDVEFYLPLADYLKSFSYGSLALAPENPLRDLLLTERIRLRAMGGSYVQGMADLLVGRDAWATWTPMLALLRALTLPGLYALLRDGLGVRPLGALVGCTLAGVNALLLWTTYNSFGMSLAGTALLPAAVLATLVALEGPERRAVVGAGLLLGGLSCIYWPILQPYGAAALGCGLALLARPVPSSRQPTAGARGAVAERLPVIVRGLAILALGGLFGLLAHLRAPDAFLGVFEARTPSMGVTEFISPAVIAGSEPYSHLGSLTEGSLEVALAWAGLATALLLLANGVWNGARRRSVALGIALCSLAYLLGLQLVVRFPYGLLRGASYISPLLLGLVGAGAASFNVQRSTSNASRLLRVGAGLGLTVLLISSALATYRTYAVYAAEPPVYGADEAAARDVVAGLGRTGPVLVSAAPELWGPHGGAWSYALREREMLGYTVTGYSRLINPQPGIGFSYVLLRRGEDPHEYGLDPSALVWEGRRAALYESPEGQTAWLSGRAATYDQSALLARETNESRAQIGVGPFAEATPEAPLVLYASANMLRLDPTVDSSEGERRIVLALASAGEQEAEIDFGGGRRTVRLGPGVTIYTSEPLPLPSRMQLRVRDGTVALRWAALREPAAKVQPEAALTDTLTLRLASETGGALVDTRLSVQNSSRQIARLAVEFYEVVPGFNTAPSHYAWALFPAPADGEHRLQLDLQGPAITLDGQPLPLQAGDLRDGEYFGALWVYQGEQVRRVVPFVSFTRSGGQVQNVQAQDLNADFTRLPLPAQSIDAATEEGPALLGFELGAARTRPGQQLRAALLWEARAQPAQVYLVFVQLLDATDRKAAQWDGAAGGDWYPTSVWQPGQQIWQDVPLQIAADAPPGSYRLIAGLYNPADGQRLRFADGSDSVQLGTVEVLP